MNEQTIAEGNAKLQKSGIYEASECKMIIYYHRCISKAI